jgi:DNA-binding transcriptional MerR regulator
MRIGELSRRTGVSQRSLRYYEEQGLLMPARLASGTEDRLHRRHHDLVPRNFPQLKIFDRGGYGLC